MGSSMPPLVEQSRPIHSFVGLSVSHFAMCPPLPFFFNLQWWVPLHIKSGEPVCNGVHT